VTGPALVESAPRRRVPRVRPLRLRFRRCSQFTTHDLPSGTTRLTAPSPQPSSYRRDGHRHLPTTHPPLTRHRCHHYLVMRRHPHRRPVTWRRPHRRIAHPSPRSTTTTTRPETGRASCVGVVQSCPRMTYRGIEFLSSNLHYTVGY
jgi:hypothetical protein